MADPEISVVMSVYNEEHFIQRAVDSILNQTYRNFEFIIINDGSTDSTGEILESYNDSRIHLIHQENLGLTESLNKGIRLAKGEFIARMDGDDISRPQRLAKQVAFLDIHPDVGLLGTFVEHMDEEGQFIKTYTYPTTSDKIREVLWHDCPLCHSSVIFRKICIDTVGVYREKIGPAEDYDLWFRISEHFEVANIPEPLHRFRIDPYGISLSRRFHQIRSSMLVRRLARERRQLGNDSLERLNENEIRCYLEHLLPETSQNRKKVLNDNYLYIAETAYATNKFSKSLEWLFKAFWLQPLSSRACILGSKLLLASLFGEGMLDRLNNIIRSRGV